MATFQERVIYVYIPITYPWKFKRERQLVQTCHQRHYNLSYFTDKPSVSAFNSSHDISLFPIFNTMPCYIPQQKLSFPSTTKHCLQLQK
jgi:hypothetical protein